jgi:hypothetical protein
MRTRKQSARHHLLLATGLALVAVAGLLWWTGKHAPAAQALTAAPLRAVPIHEDGIGAAWASFDPTSTLVLKSHVTPWEIKGYGVAITFYWSSLGGDAVFTFTPQADIELSPPEIPSYAFSLVGTYVHGGGNAAIQVPISIALTYEHAEIKDVQERTLTFFHYDEFRDMWLAQDSRVDATENTVACSTRQTGLFTLAGYRHQVSLPIAFSSSAQTDSTARRSGP